MQSEYSIPAHRMCRIRLPYSKDKLKINNPKDQQTLSSVALSQPADMTNRPNECLALIMFPTTSLSLTQSRSHKILTQMSHFVRESHCSGERQLGASHSRTTLALLAR
jgi:hypothetical protein